MKKKKNEKLKVRAMRQIAVLIILVMTAAFTVFYVFFREAALREHIAYSEEHLNSVGTYLNDYIDEVDSIAKAANYNYYLQNYLMETLETGEDTGDSSGIQNMQEYEMSSMAFRDALLNRTDVSSIMVFDARHLLFYQTLYAYRNVISDYSEEEWYKKALENPGEVAVTGPNRHPFFDEENEATISLSRVIQSYRDGSFLGVILVDVNRNEITKICESYQENKDGFLCILNEKGQLVYEQQEGKRVLGLEDGENLKLLREKLRDSEGNNFKIQLNNVAYMAAKKEMTKTGWTVLSFRSYASILENVYRTGAVILLAAFLALLAALVALNGILGGIIAPLNKLQRHMERVNIENFNQQVPIYSDDEIGKLSRNFNEMLERIDNLKEQVVEEQENKRKYELQALQAQINPHFLYNTLDAIIWMAETNDKNIVPMTEALAKFFRISLNKGNEEILLKKEMEHVKNYLIIQSVRYADKFTYEFHVEPEVENCHIIKLIIQPIVENCIYHGIKLKKGTGHISIEAWREGEFLKIHVKDDGGGMSKDMCEKIVAGELEPANVSGSGIGVKNVNERIRLRFGPQYGLRYESEEGKGTTVEYLLPFVEGGDRV